MGGGGGWRKEKLRVEGEKERDEGSSKEETEGVRED